MTTVFRAVLVSIALGALAGCSSDTGSTEPGNPVTINWSPCINDLDAPSWFAVQDGTTAWARVTPTAGVFSFTVRADKIGIATFADGLLSVIYATPSEIQSDAPSCLTARRTVTGTVTGYSTLDDMTIAADLGGASVSGTQTAPASFTLTDVTPSTFDVLAVRSRTTVSGSTFLKTPTSVFIRRAQTTSPLAAIDFNSATEAGAPLAQTATIVNAASGESLFLIASLNTPTTALDIATYTATVAAGGGNVTAPFSAVPTSRLVTGDAQTLDVSASKSISSATNEGRFAAVSFTTPADKTLTLGPALGTVTVTGTARPTATYTIQAGYDQTFEFDLDQGGGVSSRSIQMLATRGYVGSAATQVTLQVPDLSRVNGFQSSWVITPGTSAVWTYFAAGATLDIFRHNNQTYLAASRSTTFTP